VRLVARLALVRGAVAAAGEPAIAEEPVLGARAVDRFGPGDDGAADPGARPGRPAELGDGAALGRGALAVLGRLALDVDGDPRPVRAIAARRPARRLRRAVRRLALGPVGGGRRWSAPPAAASRCQWHARPPVPLARP
jgi:hypothetical protein